MKKEIAIFFIAVLSIGCNSLYSYRPLSYFTVRNNALKDRDTIQVLYCSGGPTENKDRDFYYHVIVETVKDHRRLNMLVTDISSLSMDHPRKVFVSSESDTYKIIENPDEAANGNISDLKVRRPSKVVYNPRMPVENNYLTVIGALAEDSFNMPEDVQRLLAPHKDSMHNK